MSATIVIVEDDSELAASVADDDTTAGDQAQVIGDGRAALASIQHRLPDMIVLEFMLPGLDGLSLCRTVRPNLTCPCRSWSGLSSALGGIGNYSCVASTRGSLIST